MSYINLHLNPINNLNHYRVELEEKDMKRILVVFMLLITLSIGTLNIFAANPLVELNVSAAVSLKDALLDIQKTYLQKQPNIKINFNLGSSGALQTQIEQGAPADIFISAAVKQMDALEKKDLLMKGTRKNLLENQLALIVPKDSTLNLKDFKDLTRDEVKKIGIGAPESVPAGQYAQEVFKYLNIWDKLQGKTVFGTDVRAVLTYVETGNVDAGIVYRTDALISDKIKIVAAAPVGSHEPIVYPAAILKNTAQPKATADFLAFLSGPEGKTVFEKYGFIVSK
jgi:molybdate transport system substrate-binding protein